MTFLTLGAMASAQQLQPLAPVPDWDKIQIKTINLGHRTYVLQGEGGNITVAVGDDGAIVIDSQFAPLYGKIKAAIAAVTDKPVRYLIITHFHRDHIGSAAAFGKDGATIVAQENARARMATGTRNGLTGNVTPPMPDIGLPTVTYKDAMTLRVGGRTAELQYSPFTHTDGDTYVYFPDVDILATGDVVFFERYPNIDFAYGGSIDGMIHGVEHLIDFAKDSTTIVPGHGPVGTKAMMRDYRQMLVTARDRVQNLKAAGKTEDEIVAARPNADLDAKFGTDERSNGNFIRVIYRSLKS
jgi:cyclase